jgi:type IV pilus assembly protein PilE
MKAHGTRGFTLIELMVACAVVAILAAIAYPSYVDHIAKVKRAEGKSALLKAAQLQERFYTSNGFYSNDLGPLFGLAANAAVRSGEDPAFGNYNLTVATTTLNGAANQAYTLTATPNAAGTSATTGGPFVDAICGNFTLTSTGVRAFSGTPSARTPQLCW